MKAFGKKAAAEAEGYVPETQNTYASIDVAASKPSGGAADEYKGYVHSQSLPHRHTCHPR